MSTLDWSKYPNFDSKELACRHCGAEGIMPAMMDVLQGIRDDMQSPIFLSSGYRCPKHPVEQEKDKPGEHTQGLAVDILCHGDRALNIIKFALLRDVKRLGVHQKGNANGRYVHIGIADKFSLAYPGAIWTY